MCVGVLMCVCVYQTKKHRAAQVVTGVSWGCPRAIPLVSSLQGSSIEMGAQFQNPRAMGSLRTLPDFNPRTLWFIYLTSFL